MTLFGAGFISGGFVVFVAIAAADLVMSSGKYDIVTDFRSLFGSTKSTKDCILYRTYDADKGVTHSIASTCNMNDPTDVGPNLIPTARLCSTTTIAVRSPIPTIFFVLLFIFSFPPCYHSSSWKIQYNTEIYYHSRFLFARRIF